MDQWQDEHSETSPSPEQVALEDLLEERDQGPFIEITDTDALKKRERTATYQL